MDLFYSEKPPENTVNLNTVVFQPRVYSDMNGGKSRANCPR